MSSSKQIDLDKVLQELHRLFGFSQFRPHQEELVMGVLRGKDVFGVMPTGGGKSLCYQLPASLLDGCAVVVSPLIALMKDQVDAVRAQGIRAAFLNSTVSYEEAQVIEKAYCSDELDLLYVAPERLVLPDFLDLIRSSSRGGPSFFAIDEAHCISEWGHDFRPEYMRLGNVLETLGRPQAVALTATATPTVRQDILQVLSLRDPFETVSGFSRPNLELSILNTAKHEQKYARVQEIVAKWKTGIVYCATRKQVEKVSETLHEWGVKCVAYHGGMSDEMREKIQNEFIQKKADVAVATNAFGMGIDRSDVRFVVHFEIPGSVEAYYQEAGRAGRDGEAAYCQLFYNYADIRTQEFFIEGSNPGYATICNVYQFLQNDADENYEVHRTLMEIGEFAEVKNGIAVGSALSELRKAGYIERFDIPGKRMKGTRLTQPHVQASELQIDRQALDEKERRDRSKLDAMISLCEMNQCRQQAILEYFGEKDAGICGTCDVCKDARSGKSGGPRPPKNETESLIVRKALSGVARMSVKSPNGYRGVFGKGKIISLFSAISNILSPSFADKNSPLLFNNLSAFHCLGL